VKLAQVTSLVVALLTLLLGTPDLRAEPLDKEASDRAFTEGSSAFESGDDHKALESMRAAFASYPDYRTAGGLGQVELHLGHHRDAAEHLEFSLRNYPSDGDPTGKGHIMGGLKDARQHVATVNLSGQIDGTTFVLDGVTVATLPVEHDLFIEPGEHQLGFTKPGYEPKFLKVYLAAGAIEVIDVELGPKAGAGRTGDGVERRPNRAGRIAVAIIGGGITAAGLAAGAVLRVDATARDEDADALRAELDDPCRSGGSAPDCGLLNRRVDQASSRRALATGAFVGAGAAALTTLAIYSILSASRPARESATLGFAPSIDRGGASLHWVGRF